MKAIELLLLFLIVGLASSCGDNDLYDSGVSTVDGMYYVIDEPGSSEKPTSTSNVTVNYKGYYTDDVEFDSGNNISFNLQGVIEGWTIGIPKFGEGGSGHLLIPPYLAYGEENSRTRDRSVLIFDIELVGF